MTDSNDPPTSSLFSPLAPPSGRMEVTSQQGSRLMSSLSFLKVRDTQPILFLFFALVQYRERELCCSNVVNEYSHMASQSTVQFIVCSTAQAVK